MKVQQDFIYSQTRLQSRHGQRLDERGWRQLEAQNELASYLQVARQSGLRSWVITLHAHDSHHLLETTLLQLYRSYIDEVTHWQPRPWQPAVKWLKTLSQLPVLQHLLIGNTARSWMLDDPVLKPFTVSNTDQRLLAMHNSPYAPLLDDWQQGQNLIQAWLQHWKSLWPEQSSATNTTLLTLIETLQSHVDQFQRIEPEQAWPLRTALTNRLNILFRRYGYQPATAFIHLALVALDVERLRGGIVQRRLFPPRVTSDKENIAPITQTSTAVNHEAPA